MERLQNWEKLLERNFIPTPEFVYPTTYLYSFLNAQHTTWPLGLCTRGSSSLHKNQTNFSSSSLEVWMLPSRGWATTRSSTWASTTTSLVSIVLSQTHQLTSVKWCCFLLHLKFQWSDTRRNSRNAIDAWRTFEKYPQRTTIGNLKAFDSRNHVALISVWQYDKTSISRHSLIHYPILLCWSMPSATILSWGLNGQQHHPTTFSKIIWVSKLVALESHWFRQALAFDFIRATDLEGPWTTSTRYLMLLEVMGNGEPW